MMDPSFITPASPRRHTASAPAPLPLAAVVLALAGCAGPALAQLPDPDVSSYADEVRRYSVDERALESFYTIDSAPDRLERFDRFEDEWTRRLEEADFEALDTAGRIDHVLLRSHLEHGARERADQRRRLDELADLVPFRAPVIALEEGRWRVAPLEPRDAAGTLAELAETVADVKKGLRERGSDEEEEASEDERRPVSPVEALRAARLLGDLQRALETWYDHYASFRPDFAWWVEEPYGEVKKALEDYVKFLREDVAGQKGEDDDPLVGDPIGREALLGEIAHEMLPYGPEELVAIAEEQFRWCEAEMVLASREMGFGDDWKAALEEVKKLHVSPGSQDDLVARQAREMIDFLDEHDLVTIPDLCRETWRVDMLDRRGQRTLPFAAYGGQRVLVAYPTSDMSHDEKLMAMRGNNVHFTRSVTPHELIPGHHLQGFMAQRHGAHRRIFSTPFLGEGWALYWEMLEYELGWPRGPQDRIGMLFWRMHRAARIIVSLRFHLGTMTPPEMIDFLVERVGHERENATSEVRRFIGGAYGPLYQCAYMIGGIQLWALREELVDSGRMTNREFHDAILLQNSLPIELIRAALLDQPPARDHRASWRFAGDVVLPD